MSHYMHFVQCDEQKLHCELKMEEETILLKIGETFMNPEDPCEKYKCDVSTNSCNMHNTCMYTCVS